MHIAQSNKVWSFGSTISTSSDSLVVVSGFSKLRPRPSGTSISCLLFASSLSGRCAAQVHYGHGEGSIFDRRIKSLITHVCFQVLCCGEKCDRISSGASPPPMREGARCVQSQGGVRYPTEDGYGHAAGLWDKARAFGCPLVWDSDGLEGRVDPLPARNDRSGYDVGITRGCEHATESAGVRIRIRGVCEGRGGVGWNGWLAGGWGGWIV